MDFFWAGGAWLPTLFHNFCLLHFLAQLLGCKYFWIVYFPLQLLLYPPPSAAIWQFGWLVTSMHGRGRAESQKPLQRGSIAARKFWQIGWSCGNVDKNLHSFVAKVLPSFMRFRGGEQKLILFCCKISTKIDATLFEYFPKNVHS